MSEYRWSAERRKDRWPDLAGHFGVRLMFNGEHVITIYRPTEPAAQSLIDWINRTDLPECPEWATWMPVASGAALRANDPEGEWGREGWVDEWLTDHHTAADDLRYPICRTPAPAEPLTERVPLAECLGRAVLEGGELRVIDEVSLRMGSAHWHDASSFAYGVPVAPDGTVEVLRRSIEDGKR